MKRTKDLIRERSPQLWRILKRFRYPAAPIPGGVWLLNLIVQRVFRINASVPWMVHYTSQVVCPERISIGRNVWKSFAISGHCYVQGGNGIKIGDDTIFAPGIKIISANHCRFDLEQWILNDPIVIGNNCWIGANAVILPAVRLGNGCVVGAGAVVTKSFGENSILVGVPATDLSERSRHLDAESSGESRRCGQNAGT